MWIRMAKLYFHAVQLERVAFIRLQPRNYKPRDWQAQVSADETAAAGTQHGRSAKTHGN